MDKEELIAKYLRNELSKSEIIEFEKLLDSDHDFKEQFEFETQVKKAIFKQEHQKNKQFLVDVENEISHKSSNTKWYLVAASVVILISIGFLWNLNSSSPDKLFDSYYTVASNTSHPIVRSNTISDDQTSAFIAYESEAYEQAQILFDEAYKNSNNSELLFYEAICYLEIENTTKAIETFLKHQSLNDRLQEKSKWYLALAYLKNEEPVKAKNLLEKITKSPSNYNYIKAKDLLSKF
ncbi:tetratricopeptide repeat protein [Hanstruepera marina]|uniref:tetratricopeptide repeat protein n=1 Tax=Hanstruepera marina TaxID=2873265 RepID=UPI001CA734F0|nr:hypothetical protein [Hanstruepera marina]